jgi:uncharacterized protein
MSQQNVQLVLRLYAAFNRRDAGAVMSGLHRDVEFHTTVEAHRGHDGVAEWVAQADAVFDSLVMDVEETIDAGDRVVAVVHERATGRGSGLDVDQRLTHVWTIRDGRVASMQAFTDRAVAVEAAGVSQ